MIAIEMFKDAVLKFSRAKFNKKSWRGNARDIRRYCAF